MTYRKDTETVLYRSKMNPVLKTNFAVFPVLDWIAEPTVTLQGEREKRRRSVEEKKLTGSRRSSRSLLRQFLKN